MTGASGMTAIIAQNQHASPGNGNHQSVGD